MKTTNVIFRCSEDFKSRLVNDAHTYDMTLTEYIRYIEFLAFEYERNYPDETLELLKRFK